MRKKAILCYRAAYLMPPLRVGHGLSALVRGDFFDL
jgi:hypothetical protein